MSSNQIIFKGLIMAFLFFLFDIFDFAELRNTLQKYKWRRLLQKSRTCT